MKKLKILFACVENSFRSQIAQGVALKYFQNRIIPFSAGSKPIGAVHENAVKILKEMDLDLSLFSSKGFNDLPEKSFDYLVTMGCGEVCPFVPSKKHVSWDLEDIKNSSIEEIRKMRDGIKNLIEELLKSEGE